MYIAHHVLETLMEQESRGFFQLVLTKYSLMI